MNTRSTARRELARRVGRRCATAAGLAVVFLATTATAEDADIRLIDAVKRQDATAVRTLLSAGADANAVEPDGTTALAWAAHRDEVPIARMLIRAGANPNAANYYGATPLLLACTNRSAAIVEALLKSGANPNATLRNGETPLMTAARTGDMTVVKLLLAHGADAHATEHRRHQTALMWAVAGEHPDIVRLLIEAGSDLEAVSTTGFSPLMFAARNGQVQIAKMLMAAGASVDRAARDGTTALLVAAGSIAQSKTGHEAVGSLLLEHGADPNVNALPYTALHMAVATGKAGLVTALLAHGANPNARAAGGGGNDAIRIPKGATAFWLAAKEVDADRLKILAAAGANPALMPEDGTTPLMVAAGVGQVEGPRVNAAFASPYRSRWDETRALDAVAVLLQLGADINAVNKSREWSALHGAAHIGADRMVHFLVEHGAKVDAKDKNGQTPWSLAAEGARDQLTRIPHTSTADLLRRLEAMRAPGK